jgi:hypothetical protein
VAERVGSCSVRMFSVMLNFTFRSLRVQSEGVERWREGLEEFDIV